MTIKPPKLKLRTLLAAVAVIAVAMRCAKFVHISYVNERLADFHNLRGHRIVIHGNPTWIPNQIILREAAWHARMEEQYRRAIWRPWLEIELIPEPN